MAWIPYPTWDLRWSPRGLERQSSSAAAARAPPRRCGKLLDWNWLGPLARRGVAARLRGGVLRYRAHDFALRITRGLSERREVRGGGGGGGGNCWVPPPPALRGSNRTFESATC